MPNEAIERAAGELMLAATMKIERDALVSELTSDELQMLARAAISAYFADVPVSLEMVECGLGAYDDCNATSNDIGGFYSEVAQFKAMCAKHEVELSNGR